MARATSNLSVIGASTRLIGHVSGDGGVRVEGTVRGDISVDGPSEIADGGVVEGDFRAGALDISGSLIGNANTEGPIRVRSSAVVRGELTGSEISIEQGARVAVVLDARFDLEL